MTWPRPDVCRRFATTGRESQPTTPTTARSASQRSAGRFLLAGAAVLRKTPSSRQASAGTTVRWFKMEKLPDAAMATMKPAWTAPAARRACLSAPQPGASTRHDV